MEVIENFAYLMEKAYMTLDFGMQKENAKIKKEILYVNIYDMHKCIVGWNSKSCKSVNKL